MLQPNPRILLIGNYDRDRQESMVRFAELLQQHLLARGFAAELIRPPARLAARCATNRGLAKWLGYADKFLLFPAELRRRIALLDDSRTPWVAHICDHSNAVYTRPLRARPHLVTCHDLLAVRSALGEFPAHPTRWTGRCLQRWIRAGLMRADRIVCDSDATCADVIRLIRLPPERVRRQYLGLHYPYQPMPENVARDRIARLTLEGKIQGSLPQTSRYLLHVGGNQWYKNRPGLVRAFHRLDQDADCPVRLVLVGKPWTPDLARLVRNLGLAERIALIQDCANEDLQALYSAAEGLVFPSLAEGFGWPLLEAQACSCPVITANRPPMTEVGGETALYIDPSCDDSIARGITELLRENPARRRARIENGLANARRFSVDQMIQGYSEVYRNQWLARSRTAADPGPGAPARSARSTAGLPD